MLSDVDHVASQEKEKLALQRVAEIRRLAVQLNIKQNMFSSSPRSNGGIDLLRKELIEKTQKMLTEFDITETYNFKLDFQEETMSELVSTLTKLRKFILSQIRMARHVHKIQYNKSKTYQSSIHNDNDTDDMNNNSMNSSSVIIRDFSNYSTPSKSTKNNNNNNNNNNQQPRQKNENQIVSLKVKTPPSSVKSTIMAPHFQEINHSIKNYPHADNNNIYNYNSVSNKEEEKNNSTFLELTTSSLHQTDINEGQRQRNQYVSPNRSEHKMLLEDSIDHRRHNDSIDEIDLRIRQQEMERLRHFRQLAEQQVETKLNAIQDIMDETNNSYHPSYNNNHDAYNNIEEVEYHVVQNISPPPAPPRTPPNHIEQNTMAIRTMEHYNNMNNNDELNDKYDDHQNPLETSLDALMSLASTPLSKLRQEENEIFAENHVESNHHHQHHHQQQQLHQQMNYQNVNNNMYSPTTNVSSNIRYNMNAPITPNQMPVPIPINPSTPYAMPSPPKPLRQSTPVLPPSQMTTGLSEGRNAKQRRNAVPEMALRISAEQANKQKRYSMIALLQQQQQQQAANLGDDNNNSSIYNQSRNFNRLQQQESTDFIDPEDDENVNNIAKKDIAAKFEEEESKLKNSQVHFYDSKVKLGDISKVSFYESSGVDSSYDGGDASAYQKQSNVIQHHQQMHQEQQRQ